MKIKIYENEKEDSYEERIVRVDNWSIIKAVFIGSLLINLIVIGGFIAIGIIWGIIGGLI